MQFPKITSAMALSAFILASGAAAQPNADDIVPSSDIVAQLFDCRSIEAAEERLACFDREVARVYAAQESKELVITDREQIKETRKGLFGFTLPKIGLFRGEEDGDVDDISEVTAVLASAGPMSNGRYVLTLEDGARWEQVDKVPVFGSPGAGDEVVIKKGLLGSYSAKIGSRRAFKVKRIN